MSGPEFNLRVCKGHAFLSHSVDLLRSNARALTPPTTASAFLLNQEHMLWSPVQVPALVFPHHDSSCRSRDFPKPQFPYL